MVVIERLSAAGIQLHSLPLCSPLPAETPQNLGRVQHPAGDLAAAQFGFALLEEHGALRVIGALLPVPRPSWEHVHKRADKSVVRAQSLQYRNCQCDTKRTVSELSP